MAFERRRSTCRRRSRRAQAGATFSPAPSALPLAWSIIRFRLDVSRRSFLRGASSGSRISSTRSRWAPYRRRVRFRPSLVRRQSPMTALPWLLVPGFLVPILMFIHIVIFARLRAQSEAPVPASCVARRWRPAETGVKRATPRHAPRLQVDLGSASRPFGRASKRRRATLPVSAPPPVPQAYDSLRLGERDSYEAGAVGGLNAHHDRLLALALRVRDFGLDVCRARHGLACDIEDDVALSQSLLSCRSVRVDSDDLDALVAVLGRSDLDAERARLLRLLPSALATVSFFWSASVI